MNNNSILDDEIPTNKTNDGKYQFQVLYEKYTAAAKLANRWKKIAIAVTAAHIFIFFTYYVGVEYEINTIDALSYLWGINCFISLIAYFTHFFALQQKTILVYLFPNTPNINTETVKVWILIVLSILYQILSEADIFPKYTSLYHIKWFLSTLIAVHLYCLAAQQLLLNDYKIYLPAIFKQQTFAPIGLNTFIYCILTGLAFVIFVSYVDKNDPEFFIVISFHAMWVNFSLAILSIILRKQAEKHSVDNKTV